MAEETSSHGEYIKRFFKCHDDDESKHHLLARKLESLRKLNNNLIDLKEEECYYVVSRQPLIETEKLQIIWLIEPDIDNDFVILSDLESHLRKTSLSTLTDSASQRGASFKYSKHSILVEVGPRLNFCTPFSTNAVSILRSSCPNTTVYRIEKSIIYQLIFANNNNNTQLHSESNGRCPTHEITEKSIACLYDPMVECIYPEPLVTFDPNAPRSKIANGEEGLQPCDEIDILKDGKEALQSASLKLGLFFDDWDIEYYCGLFRDTIKRNPTVTECFDLAQSNSEHSRHWFFKGILDIEGRNGAQEDGLEGNSNGKSNTVHEKQQQDKTLIQMKNKEQSESLIDMVTSTQFTSNQNNLIKFSDNSSAIEGFKELRLLAPSDPSQCNKMEILREQTRHIIFTAETHNFPTGVAPFPGAATGTGGRIRDVQATGRGAHTIAGTAGYSFGNLFLDDHEFDWENPHELYPNNLAHPNKIAIEASNGASDYGNKFGEPIILGFARSFGMRLVAPKTGRSERWEYLKPIMFTGGIGSIDDRFIKKERPAPGMLLAKVGGPVYRIGMGGGAASSAPNSSTGKPKTDKDTKAELELNFNAVQRGDPEMEQKMNRVIRACIENRISIDSDSQQNDDPNPILSIHDQGAGGNGNVLKELAEPVGATIDANKFTLGDPTLNILELWAAEYQESDAFLLNSSPNTKKFLESIEAREKCKVDIVGQVEDTGLIKLCNFDDFESEKGERKFPIDLKLDYVIGSMPRKTFKLKDYSSNEFLSRAKLIEIDSPLSSINQPAILGTYRQIYTMSNGSQMMSNFEHLLMKVLRLPSVGSKRYLTTKVDRCVTGLIAGQQCLGPLHTPISDYALIALSHFEHRGAVTSIGEQPIKGLVSPISNGTMSVAEAVTNMMFCVISSLEDIKCSANWMWAAKLPGEGAKLVDACRAMCDLMCNLGIAVDGGKDSLSMSANVDPRNSKRLMNVNGSNSDDSEDETDEIVKSPGTLVISAYAPVEDIRCKVTPILRCKPKRSHLLYVNLAHPIDCKKPGNKFRLGGSAILQTLGQIGNEAPTIDYPHLLKDGFNLVQDLIKEGICTAGHDVSDGGLIVCALEMAIASHCGIHLNIKAEKAFRDLSCANNDEIVLGALFSEECAVIIEVEAESESELNAIIDRFDSRCIQAQRIGFGSYENQRITIKFQQQLLLEHDNNHKLRDCWEQTSRFLDKRQATKRCVDEEYANINERPNKPKWMLTFDPNPLDLVTDFDSHYLSPQPKAAVLREEGINGDREMMASLALAGFQVFDLTMTDLLCKNKNNNSRRVSLDAFQGLIFPGGFSYADVFGSGRGWAASLIFNESLRDQLLEFRRRPNTFSLGVCNGCQLMSLLGFFEETRPNGDKTTSKGLKAQIPSSTIRLVPNDSGRFECRWVNVRIEPDTQSIMLKNMGASVFGVWVAHGEGKFKIDSNVEMDTEPRIALKYVDDFGKPSMEYPINPNGSDQSTAGVCSPDGRHLAMMPHPERCTQMWQWPYVVPEWTEGSGRLDKSPWMQMFKNAYLFCKEKNITQEIS